MHPGWPTPAWWPMIEFIAFPCESSEWYESCCCCLTIANEELGCCKLCSKEPPQLFSCWWCSFRIWLISWFGTENRLTSDVNVVADPRRPLSLSESPGVEAVVIAIITVVVEATRCSCIIARSSDVATDATERECLSLSILSPVKDSCDEPHRRWVPPDQSKVFSGKVDPHNVYKGSDKTLNAIPEWLSCNEITYIIIKTLP